MRNKKVCSVKTEWGAGANGDGSVQCYCTFVNYRSCGGYCGGFDFQGGAVRRASGYPLYVSRR